MTSIAEQLEFQFASLDFPGRTTLYPHEVAEKLGISLDQIYDLADEGELGVIDLASKGAGRRLLRIPLECYRDFVLRRFSGPHRDAFLRQLPKATLRELRRELDQLIAA